MWCTSTQDAKCKMEGGIIALCAIFFTFFFWHKLQQGVSREGSQDIGITISKRMLKQATQNFDARMILGRGGFGPVYLGKLDGREVAVKVLDAASQQTEREFLREVTILSDYRHPNLLPLLKYCISQEDRFFALVYPRMVLSLDDSLQLRRALGSGIQYILSWSERVNIASDAASGLAYLHSSDILHRDIKSSNILLDEHRRARISDVGLARTMQAGVAQTVNIGTFGYMDTGYMQTGEFTPACDVFSFGVVLLELMSGQEAVDSSKRPPILHARIGPQIPQAAATIADPSAAWPASVLQQFARKAKECISPEPALRPSSQVVADVFFAMSDHEPLQNDRECVLCMNNMRRTRLRPCFHVVYCVECANAALQRNNRCPICRTVFTHYDVGTFNQTFMPP